MEFADFAVEMEETLAKTTTEYECTVLDEDEIAMGWQFIFEDSIDGFIACEKEDELFGFPTLTIALRIADVTNIPEFFLKSLFELNMAFINVSLALLQIPEMPEEQEQENEDYDDENDEQSPDEPILRDTLVMRSKIPFEQFHPTEFEDHLRNLVAQAEVVFEFLEQPDEEE